MPTQFPLKISSFVRSAMENHQPVLALESTVVTHGLPYPRNFEVLEDLEAIAIAEGVIPATIAVIDGECCIGLDQGQKQYLAEHFQTEHSGQIKKLGIRDLSLAMVMGYCGGTTVSATMFLAQQAGIKVFATGGIGGVHRAWQDVPDVSSDLQALSRIPVIVVCAGTKAILDVRATLEVLESMAIPVLGWHCDDYPVFYSRKSGLKISRIDSAAQIAQVYRLSQSSSYLNTGILVANPIPEADEIPASEIEPFIQSAIHEAELRGIGGKELTPFLLSALAQSTAGKSVESNLALLRNNVSVGAKIARELE
ncbi:MAG: pseudouridine-5'-phosphate glycosidase [Candidatus Cloacimonetes bacterium]|nr:pseudouridine-5'-phosphate glycosidase [Candidatus Cloacimonadota bacterium]